MLSSFSSVDSSGGSSRSGGGFSQPVIGVILLRLGAGLTLLYLHGWNLAITVWQHLWNQAPWEAVGTLESAGIPLPKVLAVAGGVVIVVVSVSWILGFFTRLSSALFLPVAAIILLVANRTGNVIGAELAILYFFIALTLLFNGSGWLAIDTLFKLRQAKSRW